jgi:hypothetical protein
MRNIKFLLPTLLSTLLAISALPVQAQLYKWTDENGKIYYSDKVPPQHAKHQRDVLNEQGLTVEKIEAAKTAEQLMEEEKQAKLLEEQRQKDEKQATYDQMLLNSYLSEENLISTRDAKIESIENIIRTSNLTLKNQEKRLMALRKSAANHERGGKSVPEAVLDQIYKAKDQIQRTHDYIAKKKVEQGDIREKYGKDIQRYRELKGNG